MTRLFFRCARGLGPFCLTALALACQTPFEGPINCADYAAAGINVRVADSVTGAWVASGARLITMTGGVVIDSAEYPLNRPDLDSLPLAGAWERAGVFELRVQRAGYADWTLANVTVSKDVCHVRPVRLTARIRSL
jgi:hypothetical protein